MKHKRSCCPELNGLNIHMACDNCGLILVDQPEPLATVKVIDSVKAKKALECVEEIAEKWYSGYEGGFEHWLSVTLRKYGYEKKK